MGLNKFRLKNQLSDIEILTSLEKYMPLMRIKRQTLVPFQEAMSNWSVSDISAYITMLAGNGLVESEYMRYGLLRLKNPDYTTVLLSDKPDIQTLLTAAWAVQSFYGMVEKATERYNVPYDTIINRLEERFPESKQYRDLKQARENFTAAKVNLTNIFVKVNSNAENLLKARVEYMTFVDNCEEAFHLAEKCGDAFLKLCHAHQYACERLKTF